jgi:hypothetical protein
MRIRRGIAVAAAAVSVGALGATLAAVAAMTMPATAHAQAQAGDSVTGSGTADSIGAFSIDVRSGPSGEAPTGQASLGLFGGPISCLAVNGRVARFDIPGRLFTVVVQVTDNAGTGLPDTISGFTGTVPTPCAPLPPGAPVANVLTGDIVVVDAPLLPTSKEQCKNGGYTAFAFKNQGQCVAFVERGPKP